MAAYLFLVENGNSKPVRYLNALFAGVVHIWGDIKFLLLISEASTKKHFASLIGDIDPSVVFAFLLVYVLAAICFGILVSCLFSTGK